MSILRSCFFGAAVLALSTGTSFAETKTRSYNPKGAVGVAGTNLNPALGKTIEAGARFTLNEVAPAFDGAHAQRRPVHVALPVGTQIEALGPVQTSKANGSFLAYRVVGGASEFVGRTFLTFEWKYFRHMLDSVRTEAPALTTTGQPYLDGNTALLGQMQRKPAASNKRRLASADVARGARFRFTNATEAFSDTTAESMKLAVPAGAEIEVLGPPKRNQWTGNVIGYKVHGVPALEGKTLYSHWLYARDLLESIASPAAAARPELASAVKGTAAATFVTRIPSAQPANQFGTDELRDFIPHWLDSETIDAVLSSGRAGSLGEADLRRASTWKRGKRVRSGDTLVRSFSVGDAKSSPALRVVSNLDSTRVLSVEFGAVEQ